MPLGLPAQQVKQVPQVHKARLDLQVALALAAQLAQRALVQLAPQAPQALRVPPVSLVQQARRVRLA